MGFSRLATFIFWFLPVVLQALIAGVMLRRHLVRQFPIFFTFNILIPTRDVTLYFLPFLGNLYSSVFWWGEAAAIALELGSVFENTWHFIRPYAFLRGFLKVLGAAGIIAAAAGLAMLIWTKGPSGTDLLYEWLALSERSARFLQVCLLIVAIAFMSRLSLTWRHYALGIAAGFGVYAALDLIFLELHFHLHLLSYPTFVLLRSAAYNLGVAIWAFYFLWPRNGPRVDRLPGTELAGWNDALTPQVNKWYRR